ncbi:MAG: hypothetical protein SV375_11430, partial [Thermodesulfobacteriota bacterium]|nr:hypothetical protein [Thermodesulfobacteriota bacterium]
ENFLLSGTARGLRLNTVISSGNQADLDLFDYVSYFGGDPKTRVICVYTEGIARGREFLELALEVGSEKPIIIWKSGFSQAGARAVISHTGSIAGNREIWQGAARSAGIIIAEGLEELLDMAAAFSSPVLPKGKQVGIISEAGGGGISAADSCENQGLEVRPFSPKLRETLKGMLQKYLPPFSGTSNPLDLVWLPKEVAMTTSIQCIALVAREVDSVIFMSYLPFLMPDLIPQYIEAMCRIRNDLSLPIFIVPPFGIPGAAAIKEYTSAGLPSFSSFERAAKAISVTCAYQERVSS